VGEAGRLWFPLEAAAIPTSSRFLGTWYTTTLISTRVNENQKSKKNLSVHINFMDIKSELN
jgi:hypothetical protein